MYGKSCREMVTKNRRFPAKTGGLESHINVLVNYAPINVKSEGWGW